jgi:hypothetical protein
MLLRMRCERENVAHESIAAHALVSLARPVAADTDEEHQDRIEYLLIDFKQQVGQRALCRIGMQR